MLVVVSQYNKIWTHLTFSYCFLNFYESFYTFSSLKFLSPASSKAESINSPWSSSILSSSLFVPAVKIKISIVSYRLILLCDTRGHILHVLAKLFHQHCPLPSPVAWRACSARCHVAEAGGQNSRGALVSVNIKQAAIALWRTENEK